MISIRTTVLDLCTAGLVLVALTVLARDRVLPALADRARMDPGETASTEFRFRRLATGDTMGLDSVRPSLLVVFRSTCPVCEQTAPDWRALARLAPDRTFAIGLDADSVAAAWAKRRVPGVAAVAPVEPTVFLDRLRIRAVPTTLLFEGRRLSLARVGPLRPEDHARIRRAFAPSGPLTDRAAIHSGRERNR